MKASVRGVATGLPATVEMVDDSLAVPMNWTATTGFPFESDDTISFRLQCHWPANTYPSAIGVDFELRGASGTGLLRRGIRVGLYGMRFAC